MAFIQIIDFRTTKFDEVYRLGQGWEETAAESGATVRRRILLRDRADADRYLNVVFFDSYEEAMENSENPLTQELAAKMTELVDGPPTFIDLDVVDDLEL